MYYDDDLNMNNPLDFAVGLRDRKVLDMVAEAIDRHDIVLAYQSIVYSTDTSFTAYHEGLARVRDKTGRIIPARQFIEVVETKELGRKIDCISLQKGLEMLARVPTLRLAINMSARSIGYGPWMDTLNKGLAIHPTIAERLILEITESSAMVMPDVVSAFMSSLQAKGISFALDDFGSGYTSFRYLRDMMFDIIKIDRQFISEIQLNPDNQVLTQALISIAKHFDMFTVAEGVETQEEVEFLQHLGVACLQGYFFSAPTTRPTWAPSDEYAATA